MQSILKLDDLIQNEKQFEFKNKRFTLNTSINSFIRFYKWNEDLEKNKYDDVELFAKKMDLLKILIKESDDFLKEFETLSFKSQAVLLNKIITTWNEEINNTTEELNEKTKK